MSVEKVEVRQNFEGVQTQGEALSLLMAKWAEVDEKYWSFLPPELIQAGQRQIRIYFEMGNVMFGFGEQQEVDIPRSVKREKLKELNIEMDELDNFIDKTEGEKYEEVMTESTAERGAILTDYINFQIRTNLDLEKLKVFVESMIYDTWNGLKFWETLWRWGADDFLKKKTVKV